MNLEYAQWLCDYDDWANQKFAEALLMLGDEELHREQISSFPTLLDTFAHIVVVEWVWLRRWQGDSPKQIPDWYQDPNLERLQEVLREVSDERRRFLGELDDAQLARKVEFEYVSDRAGSGRLDRLLAHAVNHSNFHRGQLATMLRAVGATPPSADMDGFEG